MAVEKKNEMIRRDTAIVSQGLLKAPIAMLFREEAPLDARIMSFDPETPEGAELLMKSEQPTEKTPDQFTKIPFLCKNWVAKAIELENYETGITNRCVRLTMFNPGKEAVAFTSTGVVKSLDLIRLVKGDGPYDPPIQVYVGTVKTRKGFKLTQLSLNAPKDLEDVK